MEMSMHSSRIGLVLIALIAVLGTNMAFADSPSVTAVLGNSEAVVGQMVQMEIKVTGANNAGPPTEISVDGLEIHQTGTSRQFEMHNLTTNSSTVYIYTILPLKPGTFTIPPQTIRVGSSSLHTPALKLNVSDSPNRSTRSNQTAQPANTNQLAFAELIVPKKSAFVGEIVPAEIRLGFDPRAHPKLIDGPEISGQGFTAQKLQQGGENLETINGRTYDVVTFKTAIAAARAGKFDLGPVKAKVQVLTPRAPGTRRSRSPFDLFNLDDPFSDPFFSDPFGQFGERREVEINSEPIAFEVKPLPANAPASFSGAIGNFTMTTEAKPKSVQVGDPITITSSISGRGNFDRVGAPTLEDEHGWHKYPPSSKFKQDDEVGISGTKTFEMVLSPNEKKQSIPLLAFSYFDPVKERYMTLHSDPIAITVQGGTAPGPSVAAQAATPASATTSAVPAKPQDILYQLTERGRVQSFTPLYLRPVLWMAQLIPLLALLGLAGWKMRQARIGNREARRIAALQHEAAELMRKLRRNDVSPREYYAEASRAVRVKAALARNADPNTIDAETAADTFGLNGDSRERLKRLFEQSDELQYSGAHNGSERISPENRRDVLELIEDLHV
jgi:BatD DUF11 like domain